MRIKYQVLIAPEAKYSAPSTDQRLELWAAICYLQVLLGEENTFILLNMGLICFTTNKNAMSASKKTGKRMQLTAAKNKSQKMTPSKLEQSFKKEENKTSISPKSRDNVKAEYSGNSPSESGACLQFLTCQHRPSHSNFPKTMISYVALKWEIPQTEATPTGR